jgi:hypothetical protein
MKIFAGYGMVIFSSLLKCMYIILLMVYQFILERRPARPINLESYAGRSISSW